MKGWGGEATEEGVRTQLTQGTGLAGGPVRPGSALGRVSTDSQKPLVSAMSGSNEKEALTDFSPIKVLLEHRSDANFNLPGSWQG